MPCCESKEVRKEKVKAMTHEERLKFAEDQKKIAYGMIGAGVCIFGGMTGGLWNSIGGGAIGAASGCSFGLIFGACGPLQYSKEALEWDKEFEAAPAEKV